MKILIFISIFLSFALTEAAGFQKGDHILYNLLYGDVQAICRGENGYLNHRYVSCRAALSSPVTHDYFIHDPIDADQVTLTAIHEKGSQVQKKSQFLGDKGISKSAFNLSVSTLLQKPLLRFGKNQILYKLTKKNKVVKEGEFFVTFENGEPRDCGYRNLHVPWIYCSHTMGICDELFNLTNNCQN